MTLPEAVFSEAAARVPVAEFSLAHLSIELGHLGPADVAAGYDRLRRHFRQAATWVDAAHRGCAAELRGRRARVSTCLVVDDYPTPFGSPAEVVPDLVRAARESGVEIDYLARESGCVGPGEMPLARLVEARLVADPPPGTNGSRPPPRETGWLCNGMRSPVDAAEAMAARARSWSPPAENAPNGHSIFIDVELWDERDGGRTWSSAFLAAVWQLFRLGLVGHLGPGAGAARPWPQELPNRWDRLPAVIQLNPAAAPFTAYRTLSILPTGLLPAEHAVRTILSQVAIEHSVLEYVRECGRADHVELPPDLVDRIGYVFCSGPPWLR